MSQENEKESGDSDDEDDSTTTSTTRLSVNLAGLSIEAETEGQEECEAMFNRTWDKILNDAEGMSDALDERMNSY
jgi:hypothetical protein